MKNLTLKKLESLKPCNEGLIWFKSQKEKEIYKICLALIEENHSNWANWLLARLLNKKNKIKWAIYSAESVLDIFEKKYPTDKRPREAIEAAKKVLKSPTKKNKASAAHAAHAAASAAHAAAHAAAYAAYAAHAAHAAHAAAHAAAYAAHAAHAAHAAQKQLRIKLVKYAYGLLLKQGGGEEVGE